MIHLNRKLVVILLFGILLISCTNVQYKKAANILREGKYTQAVIELDNYIETTNHPALKIKATQLRSEAYYQLGLKELEKQNYVEASEYFFLSNSVKADSLLDNCYFEIAQSALAKEDYLTVQEYLGFIIYHLKESEKMSEVLYNQILIQTNYSNNIHAAYETYQILQDRFPESDAFAKATNIVDAFMHQLITEAKSLWNNNLFADAVAQLLTYLDYPASFGKELRDMIGNVYYDWVVTLLYEQQFDNVQTYLLKAEEYNPELADKVDEKLVELASIYIVQGDVYLWDRDIDKAISTYKKTLGIIDNYNVAYQKIAEAEEIARKIAEAEKLIEQGDAQFKNEEYTAAYNSYTEAYELDRIPQYYEKINHAYRWIRIQNDPEEYAIEIIKQFDNGSIVNKIKEIEVKSKNNYSRQDVRITPWKVFRTVTSNSYEVRYTIVIPDRNYFFRWLVRLETGKVMPLNEITEEILTL